ncbi:DUF342 domain-containing protein [Thiospirochaeta perfilievii]|uniref:DUF342 domain-containing protein n=1 Tax=Thiospirochaeta perfilievii TaxID=252967 RepID=A0A5C1Q9N7_9SPIO|nr:FapA family protein [Thiospirochaeta perfilievii]QEN04843.1 DUF342 domain-containing protein [Thiospirochaeta perfilievii]
MKTNIKGSITIRISEDEMSAFIDFKPSQVLFEWSDDVILDLLKEAGVVKGYKKYQFSRFYDKLENCEKEESFKVATGEEPISVSLSKYKVISKGMPSSLEDVFNKLSASQGKPEVFPIDDELFIGEDPEEKQGVVLNHFYLNKDEPIVKINSDNKPKKGFTVTGKVLDSPKEGKSNYCISHHFKIDRDSGIVTPSKSGFVRIGKGWIDLIPFEGHTLNLTSSDDFSEYFLTFKPGSDTAPMPTYDDILEMFAEIDYPLSWIKEEKIVSAYLQKSIIEEKEIKFSLTKKRESVAKIDINPSKTRATLVLKKGAGPGQKLTLKRIGQLIRDSKIKGMNLDSIKKTILDFYKSKKLSLEFVIVEGKTATRGEARRLKYQKEFISVDKIEGIIDRIDNEIETFYPSFKLFTKDDISSGLLVKKGLEFAILTDPVDGDDGIDIYGNTIKGLVGNDPIIKTYENISVKQNKYIAEIDGILDVGEIDGETHLRVREHKDMFVDISVSNDAMSASFTFYKSEGSGENASIEFIQQQIEDAGVVKGIKSEVIEESYNKFINGDLISEVVFATGQVPTDKKSSRIKFYDNSGRSKFSYEVEKGTVVAKIFPSKDQSENGYDVLGTEMKSSGVISLDLKIGDNIVEEPQEDKTINLVSDINGELKVDDNSITIIDKKVLSTDVSVKTGSIKTLCSIVVKGSVMSSLYVVSGGNIKIMGTVQGALISADKNIIIAQGVKGEDKAVLRAKEKIDVKFIEKASMMAIDDIHIRKAALHTKIISNGKVLFDKNGSKVVAGETYCKKGLSVDEIGSPSGSKTKISFGQDYLIADKIKVFEGDVEKIQEDLMKIDQIFNKPNGHLGQDKIAHLRKQKVFLMKKLEKKNMKLFLLREKFEEHSKSEIIIRSKLYPGVVFESHGRTLEILDESPACRVSFNSLTGQIEKK